MARAALWRSSAIARRAGPSSASSVASAPCASKIAASSARPRSTRSSRAAARSSRTWASASSSRAASAAGSSASPSGTAGAPPIRRRGPSAKPGEAGMPCSSVSAAGASAASGSAAWPADAPRRAGRRTRASASAVAEARLGQRADLLDDRVGVGPGRLHLQRVAAADAEQRDLGEAARGGGAAARRRVGEQERRVVARRDLDELRGGPRVQPEPVADRELGLRVRRVRPRPDAAACRPVPEFACLERSAPTASAATSSSDPAATGVDGCRDRALDERRRDEPHPRRVQLASSSTICAVCTAEPRSMRTRTPSSPDASRARSTAAPISSKSVPIPSSTPARGLQVRLVTAHGLREVDHARGQRGRCARRRRSRPRAPLASP